MLGYRLETDNVTAALHVITSSFSGLEESEMAHEVHPWVAQAADEFPPR